MSKIPVGPLLAKAARFLVRVAGEEAEKALLAWLIDRHQERGGGAPLPEPQPAEPPRI